MTSSAFESTVDEFARKSFLLRIFAVVLTLLSLTDEDQRLAVVAICLAIAACLSFAPIWWWAQLAPLLRTHPFLFGLDVIGSCALLILAGPETPFYIYTLATAMLAGILLGRTGAVFFSVLLCMSYGWAMAVRDLELAFMTIIGLPSLYFVFALGAEYISRLFQQQAESGTRLAMAHSTQATLEERARVAREMHDSVSKTVVGAALQASALRERLAADGSSLARVADRVWQAAEQASQESRAILIALREETSSLPELLESAIAAIEAETGRVVQREGLDGVEVESPVARAEVTKIVSEAVRNAIVHAGCESIVVAAHVTGSCTEMTVTDDGCGFDARTLPAQARANGHFGLVGMHERAKRFGGSVALTTAPGEGTTVRVSIPLLPHPEDDPSDEIDLGSTQVVLA